jgi:hypothetical protein
MTVMTGPEQDSPYIEGDLLNRARRLLGGGDRDDIVAARNQLLDNMPDRLPTTESEARHYVRMMHILGDTYCCSEEYDVARDIYSNALTAASECLEPGPTQRLYSALLHVSLADVERVAFDGQLPADPKARSLALGPIYRHTRAANDLLMEHPARLRADLMRFFCNRTVMLTALMENDNGTAAYCLQRMNDLTSSGDVRDYLATYQDESMSTARKYLAWQMADVAKTPTLDITVFYKSPPLSAYFEMPN